MVTGLSKREVEVISHLELDKKKFVRADDIVNILKCSRKEGYKVIHNLKKKERIVEIKKGEYFLIPIKGVEGYWTENPLLIASRLTSPGYMSYRTALNFYGFTEQIPVTVFIACKRYLKQINVREMRFKFVQLSGYKFFGCIRAEIDGEKINIADKEKTLVDCLDKQQYSGGISEVAKGLWEAKNEINFTKLVDYAARMKNQSLLKRLGYLTDILKLDADLGKVEDKIKSIRFVPLSTAHKPRGKVNHRWKVIENISKEEILSWKEVF